MIQTPTSAYSILLPVYEGPLDLLLDLIERAELDITKVSLAAVTDQYLTYLKQLHERDLGDLASFLVIAARLLQIKSEALLPRPPVREPGEEDPGDALARQLIAYKRYKQVAFQLAERTDAHLRTFLRVAPPPVIEPKLDLRGIDRHALRKAMLDVLSAARSDDLVQTIAAPKIHIRDKIALIFQTLRQRGRATFRELVGRARSRLEIVVSFLAVLELIKLRKVEADQERLFGDIIISPGAAWQEDQDPDLVLEFEE
jgi:segregation and condensation protein A